MQKINWWNLSLNQKNFKALENAFQSKFLSNGPISKRVENRLANLLKKKHALLTTSGSVALFIALKSLKLKAGDEVIVPNRTFQATANSVILANLKIKLVDVDANTSLISIDDVLKKISKKTKVIIAVHLNGRSADIMRLKKICAKNKIFLIEDAAQAFYSKNGKDFLGSTSDIGCFSFGVTKFITTGQGGFLVTNNTQLYNEMKKFLFHSQSGTDSKVFNNFGFNFRASDLLAALADSQLNELDQKKQRYLKVYSYYKKHLTKNSNCVLIESNLKNGEVPIWIEVLVKNRNDLYSYLKKSNISSMKFYRSLHKSKYLNHAKMKFVNSNLYEKSGLILPCGPDITLKNCALVVKKINQFYRKKELL